VPRRRDPNFTTGHLCRFCGELVPWGTILRLLRTDPDQPGFMQKETACHTECLRRVLRPEVELTFPRRWNGCAPFRPGTGRGTGEGGGGALDDSSDIDGKPCAMCGEAIAPEKLVRLRVQKPVGPVKRPEFDEQSLPVHFECLAAVSRTRFG
jgi:hypothetical protein